MQFYFLLQIFTAISHLQKGCFVLFLWLSDIADFIEVMSFFADK